MEGGDGDVGDPAVVQVERVEVRDRGEGAWGERLRGHNWVRSWPTIETTGQQKGQLVKKRCSWSLRGKQLVNEGPRETFVNFPADKFGEGEGPRGGAR